MYRNFALKSETELVGYQWNVENPRYVVCLIHGIGEYAGRYDRIGTAFQEAGIALIAMDLRGHGLSPGTRGHTAPGAGILKDVDRLIEFAQKEYPGLPLFLYGHSMGGNIALDYRRRGSLRDVPVGYLITAPWLILWRKIPGYLYLFALTMSKVKPDFQMSAGIDRAVLGNGEIISKEERGELIHGKVSVATALERLGIAEELLKGGPPPSGPQPLPPMLLMQGDGDLICDPQGSRILAGLEKDFCDYIEWKGLYHEIHNGGPDSDGMEVVLTMIDWIQRRWQL